MVLETLRPASLPDTLKIVRGADNTYIVTVLGADGLPKDMSAYAAFPPQIRFRDKTLTNGGVTTNFAQCQTAPGNAGTCEWLNGAIGGQIHFVIPRDDLVDGSKGSTNASEVTVNGFFDVQVKKTDTGLVGFGGPATFTNCQRAASGKWSIDEEVTDI